MTRLLQLLCLVLAMYFPVATGAAMRACVDHFPPMQFLTPEVTGENIVALKRLAQLIDHDLQILESPNFARCMWMLETGQADIIAGVIDKPERHQFALLLPYRFDSTYLFVSLEGTSPIERYEDLQSRIIGVSRHTSYFERFDDDDSLYKSVVSDVRVAMRMLLKQRLDVVIVPEKMQKILWQEFNSSDVPLQVNPFTYKENRPLYFGVSKKHQLAIENDKLEQIVVEASAQNVFQSEIDLFIQSHIELY